MKQGPVQKIVSQSIEFNCIILYGISEFYQPFLVFVFDKIVQLTSDASEGEGRFLKVMADDREDLIFGGVKGF